MCISVAYPPELNTGAFAYILSNGCWVQQSVCPLLKISAAAKQQYARPLRTVADKECTNPGHVGFKSEPIQGSYLTWTQPIWDF